MVLREKLSKQENRMIALGVLALLGLFAAVRFDYYYDLNDDVLMKDILAGVYTGVPEGHNIQMLWPISALISLFYRLGRGLPWYGLFLCACHYGSLYLILKRSLEFCRTIWGKLFLAVTEGLLMGALFLEHLVYAQYTVTCTLLAAAAAFLFFTTDIRLDTRKFILRNISSVLLVSLAYLIRSEMLLLVLPLICVAGVAKWGSESVIFTREHTVKYLSIIGLILAGLLVGQAVHMIAYGSSEWRRFTEFFNNRTELYDFQAPPDYKAHQEFYERIGLTESEKILLDNYNFGMDEEIDEKLIGEIAEYAGKTKNQEVPLSVSFPEKLKDYSYRFTHGAGAVGSDYPWNYPVIAGYLMVLLLGILTEGWRGAFRTGWKLAFLFAVRTVLWMYILLGERAPVRITHSLYLMELCILAAMLLEGFRQYTNVTREEGRKRPRVQRWFVPVAGGTCVGVFLLLALLILPAELKEVAEQQQLREQTNAPYLALQEYFRQPEHAGNFYLLDVYSSVAYSEKMFVQVDNALDNYDIMGGWACKSPLQRKKLRLFGIENMEAALREREDVYFVQKPSEEMQWLFDYYEGHGTPIQAELLETVADTFEIYSVSAAG